MNNPLGACFAQMQQFFKSGATLPLSYRLGALEALKQSILRHQNDIAQALQQDLNKPSCETYMCETGMVLSEISYLQKHLRRFMKDKRARTPMAQFPAKSFVHPEPLGTVLIISPWNYPFQLCLEPLAGAIAAGNCAIVKPSKETPHTGQIIQTILQECFEETYIKAVLGSREETNQLLDLPFDFLFFTGSPAVGRLVMQKAAEHLTPVCLELGGKSPCIVDKTADISLAAKRIVFGKLLNAGQTCVAPDYLLVHKEVKDAFLQAFAKEISHAFGGQTFPYPDWVHIVNQKHFARLCALIKDQPIVIGGKTDAQSLQIEPTVVLCEGLSSPLMQEEIFGPIFPLIVFEEFDQALAIVQSLPKPLALYLFSANKAAQRYVLQQVSFGGGCINDTIIHLATSHMPFGGVGNSGMGAYHGRASFETFSHYKSIVQKGFGLDIPFRYRPYTAKNEKRIRQFFK